MDQLRRDTGLEDEEIASAMEYRQLWRIHFSSLLTPDDDKMMGG